MLKNIHWSTTRIQSRMKGKIVWIERKMWRKKWLSESKRERSSKYTHLSKVANNSRFRHSLNVIFFSFFRFHSIYIYSYDVQLEKERHRKRATFLTVNFLSLSIDKKLKAIYSWAIHIEFESKATINSSERSIHRQREWEDREKESGSCLNECKTERKVKSRKLFKKHTKDNKSIMRW